MAQNPNEIKYAERETLDKELSAAMSAILSAEQEAKGIIARAEEDVKAIQADATSVERDMRAASRAKSARDGEKAITDAARAADIQREKRVAAAQQEGDKLLSSKQKEIKQCIDELYKSLGGKA